jgi:hypothetical protein
MMFIKNYHTDDSKSRASSDHAPRAAGGAPLSRCFRKRNLVARSAAMHGRVGGFYGNKLSTGDKLRAIEHMRVERGVICGREANFRKAGRGFSDPSLSSRYG